MSVTPTPAAPLGGRAAAGPRASAGGVALVILGGIAALVAAALLFAGATALYFDTQRDSAGYVSTDLHAYSTGTYALVSDSYHAGHSGDVFVPGDVVGKIRVHTRSTKPVFIGIARAAAVSRYLGDVAREEVPGFDHPGSDAAVIRGGAPAAPPSLQSFWARRVVGSGDQSFTWSSRRGDWRIVIMNPNGARAVDVDVSIGAKYPHIVAIGFAALGAALLVGATAAMAFRLGLRRLS